MDRSLGISIRSIVLITVVILGEMVGPALSIRNKCSACQVVAGEIELGLAKERPRNHLDLRHRLDSKGQREGKIIDYKVSELRVVELLEGVCARFKSYTFKEGDGDSGEWIKVDPKSISNSERQEAETYSKELSSYCGRLLETVEDELSSKIQNGEVKAGDVESVVCMELTKNCKESKKAKVDLEILENPGIESGIDGEL